MLSLEIGLQWMLFRNYAPSKNKRRVNGRPDPGSNRGLLLKWRLAQDNMEQTHSTLCYQVILAGFEFGIRGMFAGIMTRNRTGQQKGGLGRGLELGIRGMFAGIMTRNRTAKKRTGPGLAFHNNRSKKLKQASFLQAWNLECEQALEVERRGILVFDNDSNKLRECETSSPFRVKHAKWETQRRGTRENGGILVQWENRECTDNGDEAAGAV
ncbi:hypothetical protein C8R44DRAFT_725645 [Mycena epipterygia]|nr:hypothetical protein C8R44DRAFT_725645 [Mycena epipterygia]